MLVPLELSEKATLLCCSGALIEGQKGKAYCAILPESRAAAST